MRLLVAASALALAAGPAVTQPTTGAPSGAEPAPPQAQGNSKDVAKRACRPTEPRFAGVLPGPPPSARRLDQLPPGNLEFAVQREIDGCIEPSIIRYDVAGSRR